MRKIEHIGIAVADLKKSNELFQKLLGKAPFKSERVDGEGVETSFFQVGETKVELLQATRGANPASGYAGPLGGLVALVQFAEWA